MSDTPETDRLMADYGGHHPHPMEAVDLARKLERERDEARRVAKECQFSEWSSADKLPWETQA